MAKRFRFRLETLLRIRELHEREAKRRLGAKQAQITRLVQENRETAEEILGQQRSVVDAQRRRVVDPAELARRRAWIAHLRRTITERHVLIEQHRGELVGLHSALCEARKRKRILQKLRERRFAAWRNDAGRAERTAADDVAQQLHGLQSAYVMLHPSRADARE
jgi:flagellar FliJ protein